jgi:hypothetical protein
MSPCKLPFCAQTHLGNPLEWCCLYRDSGKLIETLLDFRDEQCISCQEYLPQQVHTSASLVCDKMHTSYLRSLPVEQVISKSKLVITTMPTIHNALPAAGGRQSKEVKDYIDSF